jgi:ComF family protein
MAGLVRVGSYHGLLGHLVRAYKYQHRYSLEPILCRLLASRVAEAPWATIIETVVPVPTHWQRRWHHQVHAADVLAERVARTLAVPCLPLLVRTRPGKSQVDLTPTARLANVRGLFAVAPGVKLNGARILVVDDVRTTGATLATCARILRQAGAGSVHGAVLAVADVPREPKAPRATARMTRTT